MLLLRNDGTLSRCFLVALPLKKHFSCVLENVFCLVATTDMLCVHRFYERKKVKKK